MHFQPITELTCHLKHPFSIFRYNVGIHTLVKFDFFGITFPDQLIKATQKRRAEYLAGRWCAQQALLQLGVTGIQVGIGDHRAPIWPNGILGTITHSKDIALAMVSKIENCRGIGADIEHFMSLDQEFKLRDYILNKSELAQFEILKSYISCPLTLIFSAKESIYKSLYPTVKKHFGFDAAVLVGFNEECLWFTTTIDLSDLVPANTMLAVYYQIFDGWVLTECQF